MSDKFWVVTCGEQVTLVTAPDEETAIGIFAIQFNERRLGPGRKELEVKARMATIQDIGRYQALMKEDKGESR